MIGYLMEKIGLVATIASSVSDLAAAVIGATLSTSRNGRPGALKGDSDNLEHLADGFAFAHAKLKKRFQAHPLGLTSGSLRPLDNNRDFSLAGGEAYVNQKTSDEFLHAHLDHGFPPLYLSSDRSTRCGRYNTASSALPGNGGGE
ncbi:hypothetical protein [Paraburkholderia sp. BL6669N2]|uniref:hypothetical protein n=1 Tax=Paraburkholderia sp. BL6669N2 TaxID=1938807 RepID=UPI0011C07360|nr:hypothetical protein [Paraburkholderia sp. BL6669N2]